MKHFRVAVAVAAIASLFIGAPIAAAKEKRQEMSALQIQAMQSRDVEGSYKTVFASVISVLQDSGYRIENADRDTGLVTGLGSSKGKLTYNLFTGFGKSKKSPIVSAFIEEINPNTSRVRINFVMALMKSNAYGSQPQDEEPILDAAVYQDAFEKINQAVFVRNSMAPPAPTLEERPEHSAENGENNK
ncbi:MAG: hypothetical protein JNM03_10460 [Sphingopyxis sp.]|uniref:hypothetical protein n=1 Tax=Sphingopyxis sp. TaxID=1908224 RepID=UPI001A5451BC|nr:hypothetical protein [Sphingopyxis sp.]MBL9070399.1 hypothetical protein [Sphingopyxis sp.]